MVVEKSERFRSTAEALTVAKVRLKIPAREIAKAVDLSNHSISQYMTGTIIPTDIIIIEKLARGFQVPRAWLEEHIRRDVETRRAK